MRVTKESDEPGSERTRFDDQERGAVKDQLEALILQMHKSGILYSEAVREFKRRFILTVLQENKGNQCKAAQQLGMHRNTLSRTIAELNLDVRTFRPGARRPPRSARPSSYDKRAAR
jgi:Fis family transcriptional regulator